MSTPIDWNTIVTDLQRSVNNLALYVLESMSPPTWISTFLPNVDVSKPPPGYEPLSEVVVVDEKPKRRPPSEKKKKTYAAAASAASGESH